MLPALAFLAVNLAGLNFEGDGLIRFGGDEEILVRSVGGLDVLLKGGHEAMTGDDVGGDLGIMNLKKEAQLTGDLIPDFGDLVVVVASISTICRGGCSVTID